MHKIVQFTGYCPEKEMTETISVKAAEVRAIGMMKPEYKPVGYTCSHASAHGCNSCGDSGALCPLYQDAIKTHF